MQPPTTASTPRLALRRTDHGVVLGSAPEPSPIEPDDVVVEMRMAGLCRTDLYVASGELAARSGVVLGHEGVGSVRATGSEVRHVPPGTLVAFDPRVPCGTCEGCRKRRTCSSPTRLGIERDGVFAHTVVVPNCCVYALPQDLPPRRAAYLEPVAAALGVLRGDLAMEDRGLIVGEGRIAVLTRRVIERAGFPTPEIKPPDALEEPDSYDYVVDAGLTDGALEAMIDALRPGGRLILKSRRHAQTSFCPARWIEKEITVLARPYGSFDDAVAALADRDFVLEDLFGETFPLSDHEEVFAAASRDEQTKLFFDLEQIDSPR